MKFAFIITGSIFLVSYWVSDNVGTEDDSPLDSVHAAHYEIKAMIILNTLNKSPLVVSVRPQAKGTHSPTFYMCRLCTSKSQEHFHGKWNQNLVSDLKKKEGLDINCDCPDCLIVSVRPKKRRARYQLWLSWLSDCPCVRSQKKKG